MMTSDTLPHAAILQQSASTAQMGAGSPPKIPFEHSKTMDECRIQVLRKFRKEIVETVRFSDVSETLIACDLVSKEECYEICKLTVAKQMLQCYQKVHDIMDILVCQKSMSTSSPNTNNNGSPRAMQNSEMEEKQKGLVKELWDNFLASIRKEHLPLAIKMENELYRITESKLVLKRTSSNGNGSRKLSKEDIGSPTDFMHVQHYGVLTRSKSEPVVRSGKEKDQQKGKKEGKRIFGFEKNVKTPQKDNLNEKDPELREFFIRAGVQERHLTDPTTRHIILRFIAENGGMAAIREEIRSPTPDRPTKDQKGTRTNSAQTTDKLCTVLEMEEPKATTSLPPPATVPFEPTPKPTATIENLFYF